MTTTTTLYQRLGGAGGMARLVDDVVAAHVGNPIVKTRFENVKDLDHLKQMAREFLALAQAAPKPTQQGHARRTQGHEH